MQAFIINIYKSDNQGFRFKVIDNNNVIFISKLYNSIELCQDDITDMIENIKNKRNELFITEKSKNAKYKFVIKNSNFNNIGLSREFETKKEMRKELNCILLNNEVIFKICFPEAKNNYDFLMQRPDINNHAFYKYTNLGFLSSSSGFFLGVFIALAIIYAGIKRKNFSVIDIVIMSVLIVSGFFIYFYFKFKKKD